jgi:hypothetical protein
MEGGAGAGSRTTRFMMEGVGARVIRGPDWKWGKQVRFRIIICYRCTDIFQYSSSDCRYVCAANNLCFHF